jgi:psp operon transcriptional activator
LKNVVERAVYRSDSPRISEIVFDPFFSPFEKQTPEIETEGSTADATSMDLNDLMARPLKEAVWGLKVRMLENALKKAKFNQKKAAQLLGLTYHQFRGLYRQYRENGE